MIWDFDVVLENADAIAIGLGNTLLVTLLSIVVGTIFGVWLGIGSISSYRFVRVGSRAFVEVFLALPVLVILIWLYYCLPLLSSSLVFSGFSVAVASFALSLSAFVAEIVRAGIGSVPMGQLEAALALGFTPTQAIRYILIPQALKRSMPPLMGQYITCYKMSALASIIGVPELLHVGGNIIAHTFRPLEVYTALAIIFLVTVYPLNLLARRLEGAKEMGGVVSL